MATILQDNCKEITNFVGGNGKNYKEADQRNGILQGRCRQGISLWQLFA